MDLFILRHGYAGNRLPEPIKDDQRCLTTSGKKEIRLVAKSLKIFNIKFTLIVSSPLPRALQTATTVAKEHKLKDKVEQWEELKPDGQKRLFYNKLAKLNIDSSILIVGHEPYLSTMIGNIISNKDNNNDQPRIILKKAGLSKIRITSTTPKLKGELKLLLTPGFLKRLSKSL